MGPLLIETFRYNRWANLHLLDVCARLSEEQLQLTTAGTYGTIAATLQHLLGAEQRYLRRMIGHEPEIHENDAFPGIARLRTIAERSADLLIEAAGRVTGDDVVETQYGDRRQRIARGSGTSVQDVNRLLKQFAQLRKLMKQLKGKRALPGLPMGLRG